MIHPDIIARTKEIAPDSTNEHVEYALIHQTNNNQLCTNQYCLYINQKKLPLPPHYRLSDIHALLQHIHSNRNYSIEYTIYDHANIKFEILIYSHGHAPTNLTLASIYAPYPKQINFQPIPDVIDVGQSLHDIIQTMRTNIDAHFNNVWQDIPILYYHRSIMGCHHIFMPYNSLIEVNIHIRHAVEPTYLCIDIFAYIHENAEKHKRTDRTKKNVHDQTLIIPLHDASPLSLNNTQHIPLMFQHLINALSQELPNHSQHNIVQIHRALSQQQHDHAHPIYASIAHYIDQFNKHYNIPTN